jgi:Ca-activated chloride channel family protein
MSMERDDDREGADGAPRDAQHELLCRLVFGEVDEAERREIEAALERSPELRAQREELEATVRLVAALGEDPRDRLPLEKRAAVLEAAAPGGRVLGGPAWFRQPAVRAAAAVVLLVGGGLALTSSLLDGPGPAEDVASVDAPAAAPEETAAPNTLYALGYGGGSGSAPARGAADRQTEGSLGPGVFEDFEVRTAQGAVVAGAELDGRRGAGGGGGRLELSYAGRGGAAPDASVPAGAPDLGGQYRGPGDAVPPASERRVSGPPPSGGGGGIGNARPGPSAPSPVGYSPVGSSPAGSRPVVPRGDASGSSPAARPRAKAQPGIADPLSRSGGEAAPSERMKRAAGESAAAGVTVLESLGEGLVEDQRATQRHFETEQADEELEAVLRSPWRGADHCPPAALDAESPRDMYFRFWGDNPFVPAKQDALSTFAADVDTASYGLARRMLREGFLPPREQVRTEEFVNAAEPDLAAPEDGAFALHAELAPSPFGGREDRWLLRLGVRAMDVERDERPPLALTFVVDTSGSMRQGNRLELVKHAIRLLVGELDSRDSIAIVRFSKDATEALPPTPASSRDAIETALFGLQPGGGTNAEAGLQLGYSLASMTLMEGVQTRVVFLSDGVANLGETDQERLADEVADSVGRGIFLNTIGVGMSNHDDAFLEQLADRGQGVCDYVGDAADARRAIVERFVGSFVTVARDVKIQVEFDPNQVVRWRQLGYENRAVADRDFRNDAVDAGEIGAGHQVTCLYELELPGGEAAREAALATLRVRWKPVSTGEQPRAVEALEMERAVEYGEVACASFEAAPRGFRRAALAAQLAECLRRSTHARGDSVEALGAAVGGLLAEDRSDESARLAEMVRACIELDLQRQIPALRPDDPDAAHRDAYLDALIRSLGGEPAGGEAADREGQVSDLLGR